MLKASLYNHVVPFSVGLVLIQHNTQQTAHNRHNTQQQTAHNTHNTAQHSTPHHSTPLPTSVVVAMASLSDQSTVAKSADLADTSEGCCEEARTRQVVV